MNPFVWKVRVYWEDTDAGGVVYHSQYANFLERARTEWLRSLGIHQAELAEKENIVFAIRHLEIDFTKAAKLDDQLDVSVHSVELGGARMTFSQNIIRCSDEQQIASASMTAVCLRADSFTPVRIPESIREKITKY